MIITLVLLFMVLTASPSAGQGTLSANQIMNLAVNKIAEDNKIKAARLTYRKRYTEEDVEYWGNKIVPEKTVKEELYQVYSANGMWYEELIARNGKLPRPKDSQPRLADVRPVMEDILGKPRYNYTLEGITNFLSKDVYSISFEPRHSSLQPEAEPNASLEDEVGHEIINNLSGNIYVDMEDYSIVRVEAHLAKTRSPIRIKTVGIVYIFDVTLEQKKIVYDDIMINIRVGGKVVILGKGAKFNIKIIELGEQFKRVTINYEDYRLK